MRYRTATQWGVYEVDVKDGRVTAVVAPRSDVNEVIAVEQGDTSDRSYGLALDIGTTTVVAWPIELGSASTSS